MATQAQIDANRRNAMLSSGPKTAEGKARSRFNGLAHGLRAEQVVLPGEDAAAFDDERAAWAADFRPAGHAREILVERAAAASWRLRRCVRVEAARLQTIAFREMDRYDDDLDARLVAGLRRLETDPQAALTALRGDAVGVRALAGLWQGLAEAAAERGGWSRFPGLHDRLMNLLGHPGEVEPDAVGPLAILSFRLVLANDPYAGTHDEGPLDPVAALEVARELHTFCNDRARELIERADAMVDPKRLRALAIDAATVDTSDEGKLLHRYEASHDRSLRATIAQLLLLEKREALQAESLEELTPEPPPAPTEPNPGPVGWGRSPEGTPPARPDDRPTTAEGSPAPPSQPQPPAPAPTEPNLPSPRADSRDRGGRSWPIPTAPEG